MLQTGILRTQPFNKYPNYAYLYGIDIKVYEHNSYRPNFNIGAGLELGRNWQNPLMIMLEYYNGHLPYSTLEYQLVQLYGVGVYFHL